MQNHIRVENFFIKTGYTNWEHASSTAKGFHKHKHEFSNCHQQTIQRLMEIPNSTKDMSEMLKSNLTEV